MKHSNQNYFVVPPAMVGAARFYSVGISVFFVINGVEHKYCSLGSPRRASKEAVNLQIKENRVAAFLQNSNPTI